MWPYVPQRIKRPSVWSQKSGCVLQWNHLGAPNVSNFQQGLSDSDCSGYPDKCKWAGPSDWLTSKYRSNNSWDQTVVVELSGRRMFFFQQLPIAKLRSAAESSSPKPIEITMSSEQIIYLHGPFSISVLVCWGSLQSIFHQNDKTKTGITGTCQSQKFSSFTEVLF